jgi:hypothetical protein
MTDADYFRHPAWSCSQLKLLPDQPELFHARYVAEPRRWLDRPSKAMELGAALHRMLLLGEQQNVIPTAALNADGHRRGKAWTEWHAEHPGPAMTASEAEPLLEMAAGVRRNRHAVALLDAAGEVEMPLFGVDPPTGCEIKAKPDKVARIADSVLVVDLKTTDDPQPGDRHFAAAVVRYGYHRQAAWYLDLLDEHREDPEAFLFVAVRNEPPYECVVHECSVELLTAGRAENREALDALSQRIKSGDWSSEATRAVVLTGLPTWYRSRT